MEYIVGCPNHAAVRSSRPGSQLILNNASTIAVFAAIRPQIPIDAQNRLLKADRFKLCSMPGMVLPFGPPTFGSRTPDEPPRMVRATHMRDLCTNRPAEDHAVRTRRRSRHVQRSAMDARTALDILVAALNARSASDLLGAVPPFPYPASATIRVYPVRSGRDTSTSKFDDRSLWSLPRSCVRCGCLPVSINAAFKAFSAACCELYARLRISCRSADEVALQSANRPRRSA